MEDFQLWPFKVVENGDGVGVEVEYGGEKHILTPEEVYISISL